MSFGNVFQRNAVKFRCFGINFIKVILPTSNILWEWLGNMHLLERRKEMWFTSVKSQEFLGIGMGWGGVRCDQIRKVLL